MKIFLRVLLGLFLVVLVISVLGYISVQRSKPLLSGELELAGLQSEVNVHFDSFGIPHIRAQHAADAYRAFGFVHAQDRLFQMELMRRVGKGTLAEVLGPELVKTDAFFRTIGTHRQAAREAAAFISLPHDVQQVVRHYLEGVNAFIERDRLPVEFKLSRITPEPFTVADVYAIAGYMAYSFAYALRTDPVVEHMHSALDSTYLLDFDWAYEAPGLSPNGADAVARVFPEKDASEVRNQSAAMPKGWMPGIELLDRLPLPMLQGSNAWVVAGERSASGKPLLANDTHIKYGAPSVWYEAHIAYPGFEIYGNFLAGVPLAMVGHTRNHTWGVTMFEDDDSDFFIQRWAADDSSTTQFGESQQKPVRKYHERIAVKGAPDTTFTVYDTENGVLINAFLPVPQAQPVSMYWNYTCVENDLLSAFYAMNHSKGINGFRDAAAKIASPGLNITYADTEGNIASWACSRLIQRAPHTLGKQYLRGYAPEDAYEGYYDFSFNPKVENPESGFIASANQHHHASEGLSYPGYYAPYNRHDRIVSMAGDADQITIDDMKEWITDVHSDVEHAVAQVFAEVLGHGGVDFSEKEAIALRTLSEWDGDHQLASVGPAVYYLMLHNVLEAAMREKLGDAYFEYFLSTHLLPRSYPSLMANEASPWWSNAEKPEQGRSEIFLDAFRKSVSTLSERLGSDPAEWRWERVHTTEHEHPLGSVAALRQYFNVGPFPSPGGKETVNNAGFRFNAEGENKASYGPAMRILIDLAQVESAVSILPTGNSGNVLSPHYKDQSGLYIEGSFRPMHMNAEIIQEQSKSLKFNPKKI